MVAARKWWKLFFGDFGPDFLLPQAMKSTLIYMGWRMDVSSLLVRNLSHCFDLKESQP
jgi:hypothetical protein